MREIKFRIYWFHPESECSGFEYFNLGDPYPKPCDTEEYYSPEQYIGLKDKNGVEIYEGDNLAYELPDGRFFKSEVAWSQGSLSWVLKGEACYGLALCHMDESKLTVIGNIHEKEIK